MRLLLPDFAETPRTLRSPGGMKCDRRPAGAKCDSPAQRAGYWARKMMSPEGAKLHRRFALSGLVKYHAGFPGRVPWAIIFRPFGASVNRRAFAGIRSSPFFVSFVYFVVPFSLSGAEPTPKLHHGPVDPHWIGNASRFWYRVDVPGGGEEFFVVDGDKATRTPAFDPARAAAAKYPALGALLFHGDFYHAAASDCGCHDNRMDKIWWSEQWFGWPVGPEYAANSNVTHAAKLQGKLFLVVGELDKNVDPASTYQVANALAKAGRNFRLPRHARRRPRRLPRALRPKAHGGIFCARASARDPMTRILPGTGRFAQSPRQVTMTVHRAPENRPAVGRFVEHDVPVKRAHHHQKPPARQPRMQEFNRRADSRMGRDQRARRLDCAEIPLRHFPAGAERIPLVGQLDVGKKMRGLRRAHKPRPASRPRTRSRITAKSLGVSGVVAPSAASSNHASISASCPNGRSLCTLKARIASFTRSAALDDTPAFTCACTNVSTSFASVICMARKCVALRGESIPAVATHPRWQESRRSDQS